jgi:hypothetical protein
VVTDIQTAIEHDQWLVAAWFKPSAGKIELVLSMEKFPHIDMYEAMRMLRDQLDAAMERDHADESSLGQLDTPAL